MQVYRWGRGWGAAEEAACEPRGAAREALLRCFLRARPGGQEPRLTTKSSYIIACTAAAKCANARADRPTRGGDRSKCRRCGSTNLLCRLVTGHRARSDRAHMIFLGLVSSSGVVKFRTDNPALVYAEGVSAPPTFAVAYAAAAELQADVVLSIVCSVLFPIMVHANQDSSCSVAAV